MDLVYESDEENDLKARAISMLSMKRKFEKMSIEEDFVMDIREFDLNQDVLEKRVPHSMVEGSSSRSRFLDLVDIHKNQEKILELGRKYGVQINGFSGKIVKRGFSDGNDSMIFVESANEQGLALFKEKFIELMRYEILIVNECSYTNFCLNS